MKPSQGDRVRAVMYTGPVTWPCVLIQVLDAIIVLGVIPAPLLAYWAGLWVVMNVLIFPKDKELTAWSCVAIGVTLLLLLNFFQKVFYDATRNINPFLYGFLWRLHAYVGTFASVSMWRGMWLGLEFYTGKSALSLVIGAIIAAAILIPLRVFNNIVAAPASVPREIVADPFQIQTRFQTVPSRSCKFVLDVFLNVFVISVLTVVYFRAVFELMGKVLYPGDKVRNLWACMMLGNGVLVLCIVAQRYVVMLYRALEDRLWLRIALDDTFLLVVTFGVVNVWRGWWGFYEYYLLTSGDILLRGSLLHLAGVLGSYLLFMARTLSFPLSPERLDGALNCKTDNFMGMYLENKECCCFEPFTVTKDTTCRSQEAEDVMLVVTGNTEKSEKRSLNNKAGTGYGSTPGH
ncbi:uncharacterized protein LOC144917271 [Branchiostoma floridae x Branchiostoma belcheri]